MTRNEIELELFKFNLYYRGFFGNEEVAAIKKSIHKWKLILRCLPTNNLIFSEVIRPCGLCRYYDFYCWDCILGGDEPCYEIDPYATVFNAIEPLRHTLKTHPMHLKYTIGQINDLKIKTIEYGEWLISYLTKELEVYDG